MPLTRSQMDAELQKLYERLRMDENVPAAFRRKGPRAKGGASTA